MPNSASSPEASIPNAELPRVIERAEIALEAFANFQRARAAMNAAIPCLEATPAERALYDERYRADHECERAHWTHALHLIVSGDLRKLLDAIAMEARSVETEGLHPKDDSAGPQDIAQ